MITKKERITELEKRVAFLESILGLNFEDDSTSGYFIPTPRREIKKQTCGHSSLYWVESVPVGAGYCKQCVKEKYDSAWKCPHCGIKYGFAPGTGDCGCEVDPE